MSDLEKQAQGLAATLGQVSEQAVGLVREEIELAKAEVKMKVEKVSRGLGVAIAAGVFVLVG
ncbi:MAG: phage holin family protein, partial [Solirubrobacterales bacterium]|nr:phage holin family protein [Solirubrobacterales bacterium]